MTVVTERSIEEELCQVAGMISGELKRVGQSGRGEAFKLRILEIVDRMNRQRPPLLSEIIRHVDAGGTVETFYIGDECSPSGWIPSSDPPEWWRAVAVATPDQPMHGYRLVPRGIELVSWWDACGRILADTKTVVDAVGCDLDAGPWITTSDQGRIPVGSDGMVTVQKERTL